VELQLQETDGWYCEAGWNSALDVVAAAVPVPAAAAAAAAAVAAAKTVVDSPCEELIGTHSEALP